MKESQQVKLIYKIIFPKKFCLDKSKILMII